LIIGISVHLFLSIGTDGMVVVIDALLSELLVSDQHELVHIVVEGQEILRTSLYGRHMLSLPRIERAVEQQTHLADQFIDRGENFMAPDRQQLFLPATRCHAIVLRLILHSLRNSPGNAFLKAVFRFAQFDRSLVHAGRETFNLQIERMRQVLFPRKRIYQLDNLDAVEGFQ
jgi:hypothetical protein